MLETSQFSKNIKSLKHLNMIDFDLLFKFMHEVILNYIFECFFLASNLVKHFHNIISQTFHFPVFTIITKMSSVDSCLISCNATSISQNTIKCIHSRDIS